MRLATQYSIQLFLIFERGGYNGDRIISYFPPMAKILDKDNDTILVKFSISEYQKIANSGILEDFLEDVSDYEFVFDTPVSAAELLKSF